MRLHFRFVHCKWFSTEGRGKDREMPRDGVSEMVPGFVFVPPLLPFPVWHVL